jgi:hypothetical protein
MLMTNRPLFVQEDIESTPRTHLFTLLDIPWMATPSAWRSIPLNLIGGFLGTLIFMPFADIITRLLYTLIFGALLVAANSIHSIGHILSGKIVGAPMDELLVTASRHVNIYRNDPPNLPSRVHLGRALGGPVLNTAVGLITLLVALLIGSPGLLFFSVANLAFGISALFPVQSFDGEVIWRELRRQNEAKG